MLTRSFEREGHRVTAVADGQAALDAAADRPPREIFPRSFDRKGPRVPAVADGQAALDAAADRPFDVVLLDVALGAGPTGHDVARMLRGRRDVVPIIMLTALDSEADA